MPVLRCHALSRIKLIVVVELLQVKCATSIICLLHYMQHYCLYFYLFY